MDAASYAFTAVGGSVFGVRLQIAEELLTRARVAEEANAAAEQGEPASLLQYIGHLLQLSDAHVGVERCAT